MASANIILAARKAILTEQAGLALLADALDGPLGEEFAKAVEAISALATHNGRLIVTGMGKSGHVGRKIAATFASTGTPAHYVHPAEASHGDLGMIQREDAILALSWSGETAELRDIVSHARRFRVTLIAMTSNPASTLGREADIALIMPKAEEACPNGLAPTTSTTMQLALGDALAVALLDTRGFTPEDFGVFHPGGKLGAQLKQVRDVMHTGKRLPVVGTDSTVHDAVAEISAKGFGCVLVANVDGTLAGIITDGDLRRKFQPDLMSLNVTSIMSRNPHVVTPETLLARALEIQETHKITALVVVEGNQPVGIVHYLDLLRAGVA
jgi:arabinose-5-phosphate isomerase